MSIHEKLVERWMASLRRRAEEPVVKALLEALERLKAEGWPEG